MNLFVYYSCLGDICRKGEVATANFICRKIDRCPFAKEEIKKNKLPETCSFDGFTPIVCCPPEKNANNQITTTTKKPSINPVLKSYSATESMYTYRQSVLKNLLKILLFNYELF